MSMYQDVQIVVVATQAGECIPAEGEDTYKYEAGDMGVLDWTQKGINLPSIRIIWDKEINVCREVHFDDIKPVGLEWELKRVIVNFESRCP